MIGERNVCRYVYPQLSDKDLGLVRLSGPGLANCLLTATRAYIKSRELDCAFIEPTWMKFSLGPIIRHERDKRVYARLFRRVGIAGLRKLVLIGRSKSKESDVLTVAGLGNYFEDLEARYDLVSEYLGRITRPEVVEDVDKVGDLADAVTIHVRLGDFPANIRMDLNWCRGLMKLMQEKAPRQRFIIFSDGADEELAPLLAVPLTERRTYGNAFADMYAISKSKLLIASHSTFSAFGAFMGRVPIIFSHRDFPPIYRPKSVPEAVLGDSIALPPEFNYLFEKKQ